MKQTVLFLLSALAACAASAGMPRPMVVYYGQACDAYGQVYASGADVILQRGTQEVARCTVSGSLAPGVNFALRAPFDGDPSGGEDNYVARAVNEGDALEVWVSDSQGLRQVASCEVPAVGKAGSVTALRILAGEDADGDGMTDAWERANGLDPSDPSDAEGDDDGDGATNLEEFLAGTVPWLASDVFAASASEATASGMYRLSFASTYGKVYRVKSAPLVLDENGAFAWSDCLFSLADGTEPTLSRVEGTGETIDLFLDTSSLAGIWRLEIE